MSPRPDWLLIPEVVKSPLGNLLHIGLDQNSAVYPQGLDALLFQQVGKLLRFFLSLNFYLCVAHGSVWVE